MNGRAADVKALTEEWHTARALIRHIAKEELGWVDKPPIGPLPSRMIPLRDQLFKDPVFQHASFNKVGTVEVGMVELDRLVVYQKHIDLAHVEQMPAHLEPSRIDVGVAIDQGEEIGMQLCWKVRRIVIPIENVEGGRVVDGPRQLYAWEPARSVGEL